MYLQAWSEGELGSWGRSELGVWMGKNNWGRPIALIYFENEAQQRWVVWCIKTLNFFTCCWNDSMDSEHIIMQKTLNHTNQASNENQAWQVECGRQTRRSPVWAAQNQERRCMLQDCWNFSCGRAYSSLAMMIFLTEILWLSTCSRPSANLVVIANL